MSSQHQDTIAAVATAPGNAALAIVRISGTDAFQIADKVFSGSAPVTSLASHTIHHGKIVRASQSVDSVMLAKMDSPRTYTGENTVEITCHGGRLVVHKVLTTLIEAGARPANPGEFTLRAFLNGKMDLAQAEAVQELISAESELSMRAASRQLEGAVSETVRELRDSIAGLLVEIEAMIDFPGEDLPETQSPEIHHGISGLRKKIEEIAETYTDGRRISEGVGIVIAGKPNVGKSSLLNSLLEKDRAIITHLPGTTRDTLRESLIWQGAALEVTDTAGIRKPGDEVEEEGVRRSLDAISRADLVLFVVDTSSPLTDEDRETAALVAGKPAILVLNKSDLPAAAVGTNSLFPQEAPSISVSALTNTNMDQLKDMIVAKVWKDGVPTLDGAIITNARHKKALDNAVIALTQAEKTLSEGLSYEFTAVHLREALESVGTIIGSVTTEDILSEIFSRFCIGK